ncbi:hypothetical protein AGABI1DRAFT_115061 [Agaricus bisporus var. burnettii JB137-S8]|uniref:AB hydrolase-1 domain-containing protein n=2 Tax=Agaricus bisporus var. burnettii TaxID=192524 RepID=K5X3R8_AGABU|nr:uncharacterized protein AGABI1DRAFT_115061 [Agaricus bisporus var. burnettii JB137-S8]EKM77818.1 hypothetical protein AGABI1DRAFT_115061 [Agaricus bisporus var. burnettii JB137-S8]KAF7760119.1 hypothetical protein Agabi119p4_10795 [Agaricus bisporus var. burnettii]
MAKKQSFLKRGLSKVIGLGLIGLGLSYVAVVSVVMIPMVQTYITYAHHLEYFGFNKFDRPENYGLAPGKTVNLKLSSSDNTSIGTWFIFADSIHRKSVLHSHPAPEENQLARIPHALKTRPTILFLHGNSGTRALLERITVYTGLTARLDANLFAVDYRGFGDSDGQPTVEGVTMDARAAWDYLMLQGSKPQDVLIVGHSLGTAIASLLAADLARDGSEPKGLVLMSAFSSLRRLMEHYYLFGFIPLLQPLSYIPHGPRLLSWSLTHRFDTLTLVPEVKTSVLIAHGMDDWTIPHTHSTILFDTFLESYLPSAPGLPMNPMSNYNWDDYAVQQDKRAERRRKIVQTTVIDGFGTLEEFVDAKKEGRRIAMLKTSAGAHDIGRLEGVQDVIGMMFGFY